MSGEKNPYHGKLSPGGAKQVPAAYPQKNNAKAKKITGNDLRAGKGKK